MQFLVKLIVFSNEDSTFGERVKGAIGNSGGVVRESESKKTSADAQEHYFSFVIGDPKLLPAIKRAVEGIAGGGLMAVTDPEELRESSSGS